ncbi:MAG: response regulator [Nitrospirae bacterium]|nr:MAG: response regulator [Nitrospirota bacterium]
MSRILVIDDDIQIQELLREVLETAGHEVTTTGDARRGLALFREAPFSLVITDILMPSKEGLETIQELRREAPDVKIVAISAGFHWAGFDVLELAKRVGATSILQKPFDIPTLLRTVEDVLRA